MKQQLLIQYYEVQTALLRLEQRREAVSEERKQAKFDLRESKIKQLNYEGSVSNFFDKLSGRQEEKAENLSREVRKAQAALDALNREAESLEEKTKTFSAQLQALPPLQQLRETDESQWAALEAKYCAEALTPLLEKNREALLEYRSLMRGERPEILSVQQQQEIYSEPDVWAGKCIPLLQRLKTATDIQNIPFEISSYYQSPAAYLACVAAKHNRLDRVNQALDQVEKVQRTVKNWMA